MFALSVQGVSCEIHCKTEPAAFVLHRQYMHVQKVVLHLELLRGLRDRTSSPSELAVAANGLPSLLIVENFLMVITITLATK